jgi:hypothetical protein
VDSFAGGDGDDTFNTNVASLGALDSITGGLGNDTLNVVDTATAFTGFGGARISGIETVNINTGGAVGAIATAAGTTTAAVAQKASFSVTTGTGSTVAATQKYNVTIGGVVYETAVAGGTTAADANAVIRAVLTTVLGDQATVAVGTTATNLTVTSNVAGKALPSISIANQTGGTTTIASNSTTASADPAVSNVTGTGPLAVREVISIAVSDAGGGNTTATEPSNGDVLDVYIGGVKYSANLVPDSSGTFTYSAVAAQIASVINSVLGAGTAVAGGTTVTVTAPTAGTALPIITTGVTGATDYADTYSVLTSNIAANAAAVGATVIGAPSGTTAFNVTASGAAAVSAAATSKITVSGTAVQTSGGSDVAVTASNSVRVSSAAGAVTISTGTTSTTLIGAVTSDTGSANGDGTGVYVTGGTSVSITGSSGTTAVKVGTAPYAVSSVNTTGGLPTLNGSLSTDPTGDVSIVRRTTSVDSTTGTTSPSWSSSTANVYMNGGTTATVRGAGGTSNIMDVNTFTLTNASGVPTIGTSKLATVNLGGLASAATVNITSDAITTVSVTDSRSAAAATVNILNSGATGANSGAINYVLSNVGSTTARVTLSDAPATSVNISSGSASTFTGARNTDSGSFVTITSPAATSITLTNTLPVDLGDVLATAGKVATVNGANATGGISAILASTPNQGMAVTTGSGADTVTLKASATIASVLVNGNTVTTSINLGAGNDRLLDQGNKDAGTSATVGVGAVIDAGAGTDTVSASLVTAGNGGLFRNFEILELQGTVAAAASGALDAALLTNSTITGVSVSGALDSIGNLGSFTVSNIAGTALTVGVNGLSTGVGNVGATLANSTGTADTAAITYAATSASSTSVAVLNKFTTTGIESVSVASGGTLASASHTLSNSLVTFEDLSNRTATITITGDRAFTLGSYTSTTSYTTGVTQSATVTPAPTANQVGALKTIDGSAATGALTIVAGTSTTINAGAFSNVYTGLAITGGSGADRLVNTAASGVTTGGAGNDTIVVAGAAGSADGGLGDDTLVAATTSITLTGGGGKDGFNASAATAGAGFATAPNVTTITDWLVGDTLTLGGTTALVSGATAVASATTLNQAFDLALKAAAALQNVAVWFVYGGNTYVLLEDAVNGLSADDVIVKLNGVVDLSTATVSANVITGA